jgi:peptide-methionine (S)-S-oxide reductase
VPDLQEQLDSTLHFTVCSPVGRDDGSQIELLDVLIDAGASLTGAAEQALICRNSKAANHLLARGTPLTLSVATALERVDDLPRLAEAATQNEKQTALSLAALNGKAKGLAVLIPFGVDVRAFSTGFYEHATPLHHAVWSGSLDAVKVLVEAGASLTTRDKAEQATPLEWAKYAMTLPRMTGEYGAIAEYLGTRKNER